MTYKFSVWQVWHDDGTINFLVETFETRQLAKQYMKSNQLEQFTHYIKEIKVYGGQAE